MHLKIRALQGEGYSCSHQILQARGKISRLLESLSLKAFEAGGRLALEQPTLNVDILFLHHHWQSNIANKSYYLFLSFRTCYFRTYDFRKMLFPNFGYKAKISSTTPATMLYFYSLIKEELLYYGIHTLKTSIVSLCNSILKCVSFSF